MKSILIRGFAAGLVLFAVGAVFHVLVPIVLPGAAAEYVSNPIFRPWPGWTRTYMALHPFGFGLVFAAAYDFMRRPDPDPFGGPAGGARFGLLIALVGAVPIYLLAFAALRLPASVAVAWILQTVVQYLAAGAWLGAADGVTIRVTSSFDAAAQEVWDRLQERDTFLTVTRGVMGYEGADNWPARPFSAGTTLATRVRLLHVLPPVSHVVRVVRSDPRFMEIETDESGGLVHFWRHRMQVVPFGIDRCRYTDEVTVVAGVFTPLIAVFALVFYLYRHQRWNTIVPAERGR